MSMGYRRGWIPGLFRNIPQVDKMNDTGSTPLNHGLVAWYPFDGNASDMSGNENHGSVYGASLSTDRHGQANMAYSFDGVDDWIEVSHNEQINFDSSSKLSLNLWIKILGSYAVIEKWHGSDTYPFVIRAGLDNDHKSLHLAKWDLVDNPTVSIDSVGKIGDGFQFPQHIHLPNPTKFLPLWMVDLNFPI